MEITTKARGLKSLVTRWKRLAKPLATLVPIFNAVVHDFLLDHMNRRFESGGRYGGSPWQRYRSEPKYRKYKKAAGADPRPLWWKPGSREMLRPSLIKASHPRHVWKASRQGARFGTSVPHAARIQKGGLNQFGETAPPRRIVALAGPQRRRMYRAVRNWLLKVWMGK